MIGAWEASDRICGKRLKPLLPILISSMEQYGHLKLDDQVRTLLLQMSAATIDRTLEACAKQRAAVSEKALEDGTMRGGIPDRL